ncbi:hypothetical protein ABKV19_025249 [Rosa sericea]
MALLQFFCFLISPKFPKVLGPQCANKLAIDVGLERILSLGLKIGEIRSVLNFGPIKFLAVHEFDWGETYAGKRQPALFGQVVWAPPISGSHQYLVFVGWSADTRKLGIKYCYNRPCALYAVKAPLHESEADGTEIKDSSTDGCPVVNLTQSISSAFFPRFSPDGKLLLFLSAKSSVDSGAHSATDSLHKIDWPVDGVPCSSAEVVDVIPVVMCADDGCFPGLYCSSFLTNPWLSDGCTMIISSFWGSCQVILSVNRTSITHQPY